MFYDFGLLLARVNHKKEKQYDEFGLEIGERVDDKELEKRFHSAANFLQTRVDLVSQEDLLYFYARYKQAMCGPADPSERPLFFDFKNRKKFAVWEALGGMFREQAMREYVQKLIDLNIGWDSADLKESSGFGMKPSTMQASSDSGDSDDEPPIMRAVRNGKEAEVVEYLKDSPDLVNYKDKNDMSLLHWAADMGNRQMVELLISKGADINARDNEGQTALHYAASCEHYEVIQTLLDNNADVTIADNDGKTPMDVAESEAIIEIFEHHMSHM